MNIQRKNPAHHFRMQSEREQTLVWRSRPFTFLLWAEGGRKGSGDGESSTPDLCCAKIVARQSDCSICN